MAESHVVSGLVAKRSEIAGLVSEYQTRIDQLRVDLEHVDATIKVFEPEYDLRTLPVKAVRQRNKYFRHGERQRLVLDIMREAGRAMTSRQVAVALLQRKGQEETPFLVEQFQKAAFGSLRVLEANGTLIQEEADDGAGSAWRIA